MEATRGIVFGTDAIQYSDVGLNHSGPDWLLNLGGFALDERNAIGFRAPSAQAIRQYLTYWDKLVWTVSRTDDLAWNNPEIIKNWRGIPSPFDVENYRWTINDGKVLEQDGILKRYPVDLLVKGPSLATYPDDLHISTPESFKFWGCPNEVIAPLAWLGSGNDRLIDWSVGRSGFQGRVIPNVRTAEDIYSGLRNDTSFESPLDILLTLSGILPAPGENVPIEKILSFREERRPELLAFRAAMTKWGSNVIQGQFTATELAQARETIESALVELHKVFDESRMSKIVGSARVYLSLSDTNAVKVLWPVLGAVTAGSFHLPTVGGALAGLALNAGLTFAQRRRQSPLVGMPSTVTDYAYVYYAAKEFT